MAMPKCPGETGASSSIARHGKRASWHPSPKQAYLMRKLVADLDTEPATDLDLIDEEDGKAA